MVATIKMFGCSSAEKERVASITEYYVGRMSLHYYTGSGEEPGRWYGSPVASLGLPSIVSKKHLFNLLRGKGPDGRRELLRTRKPKRPPDRKSRRPKCQSGRNSRKPVPEKKSPKQPRSHQPGFDLTFSAPKSVSILWALAPPDIRREIEAAQDFAVRTILDLLERMVPLARRGKGGSERVHGSLLYAIFRHVAARNNQDVLLHDHVVIPNLIRLEDGSWFKVNSRELLHWARTLGPLYRNTLLAELKKRLGVEAYRPQLQRGQESKAAGWFELTGIPPELIEHFSSRTKEILSEVDLTLGQSSSVRAQKSANLRTRRSKNDSPNLSREQLFHKWEREAAALGFSKDCVLQAIGRTSPEVSQEQVKIALQEALVELTKRQSTFNQRQFLCVASEKLQHLPITADKVVQIAEHVLAHSQAIVRLPAHGQTYYTSQAVWQMEKDVFARIESLATRPGLALPDKKIERIIRDHSHLTDEQRTAMRHILSSPGSLACMTGVAGSGKSTTIKSVADAYRAQGKQLLGISVAGVAAEGLEEKTGISCRTVASFLFHAEKSLATKVQENVQHHARMLARTALGKSTWSKSPPFTLNKNSVVVLDEAGMLSTEQAARVLKVIETSGASLIAIGDHQQLPSVEAGAPFRAMTDRTPPAHLQENFRQKEDPLGREASRLMREGRVEQALEIYAKKGDLTIHANRSKAIDQLIKDWAKDGNIHAPEKAIILVQTRAEADVVNHKAQQARLIAGAISGTRFTEIARERYYIGDKVIFPKPIGALAISNGNTGTITAIARNGEIAVRLDKELTKQQRKRGLSNEPTFKPLEFTRDVVRLGYAATTHKMQGATRERAYVLGGGSLTSRQLGYVALSRSTERTKIYVDRDHAGPKLSELVKAMSRSQTPEMAHDYTERHEHRHEHRR